MFYFTWRVVFKKQQRLQGKEVRFLTRKRQFFSRWLFTIFFVEQYSNRKFHQLSFHIPLLVSKRAVVRHKIKRILIQAFEQTFPTYEGPYYKCFITLHKMKLQPLLTFLEKKDSVGLKNYLQQEYLQTFSSFLAQAWKLQKSQQKKS